MMDGVDEPLVWVAFEDRLEIRGALRMRIFLCFPWILLYCRKTVPNSYASSWHREGCGNFHLKSAESRRCPKLPP
jgi:hypothetical protein